MPVIIAADQLTGRFQVTQNSKVSVVNTIVDYIDSIEKPFIIKLLGADLGNAFWDDLDVDGVPQEARFLALFEAFDIDDTCEVRSSKGIIEIIKAMVFAQYTREADIVNTDTGNQSAKGENAQRARANAKVVKAYNEAIASVKAIQWYIEENPEDYDYDDYNGQEFTYWMLL